MIKSTNTKIRFIRSKFVTKKSKFKHILNRYRICRFLKSLYQSMKLGAIFYVGYCRKMYRENFRLPPVCIRLSAKGKTQRVCLPAKEDQNVPTAVSIMYQRECLLNVCRPLLIRYLYM